MLFNSYAFIFVFLPVTLVAVFGLGALFGRTGAKASLFVASMVFYAYWSLKYAGLLAVLLLLNFGAARALVRLKSGRLGVVLAGLALNIGALLYFKYTNFFIDSVGELTGHHFNVARVALPLGISFFTFQKIAFLVDVYTGAVSEFTLLDYCLFVSFFPQLIAGPIVHHAEVVPQFKHERSLRPSAAFLTTGIAMFVIGLVKKIVVADALAPYANIVHNAATAGAPLDFFSAWSGALSYTLQLYFDFSGYCDMAVGLALMFGIHLPFNFHSPLKATNIIDYWRRWHITLTRFLTAYLYNPIVIRLTRRRMAAGKTVLGRKSLDLPAFTLLLAFPTIFTMSVAGIWHGAGMQFLVFGVLHGAFLTVNHGWRAWRQKRHGKGPLPAPGRAMVVASWALTFTCGLVAQVFFRADSVKTGARMVWAMTGANGFALPEALKPSLGGIAVALEHAGIRFAGGPPSGVEVVIETLLILGAVVAVLALPNSQQFMLAMFKEVRATEPELESVLPGNGELAEPQRSWVQIAFKPSTAWALAASAAAVVAIVKLSGASKEFLYFNF